MNEDWNNGMGCIETRHDVADEVERWWASNDPPPLRPMFRCALPIASRRKLDVVELPAGAVPVFAVPTGTWKGRAS